MTYLIATLHTLGMRLTDKGNELSDRAKTTLREHDNEAGSLTMENVLWAVAIIIIVGIAVGAITAYVKSKAGTLK
ncbi:hypothetical protein GCM10011492_09620 [Flexivirga endophytica]|uniref:Uncharacterized protein n=1 Tax=Flexivirga endophytica TaxID=1849103 RepID=A0A916SXK7_9MICO|nr:hypothetical protein [Flexivirga endophytica]GGB21802.1 hypothetical protein GCM10011492_09620 [Flexivirga endophytica]GHB59416.1 hypothetical protein GCM10008112_30640 [Flexivirga endophytica]